MPRRPPWTRRVMSTRSCRSLCTQKVCWSSCAECSIGHVKYNGASLGGPLMIYGAKEFAEAFSTVRKNTLQIAEDIPEDKYAFRATPDVQSIGEDLAHIACATWWQQQCHGVDKKTFVTFEDLGRYFGHVA